MTYKQLIVSALLVSVLGITGLKAQVAISTSGGNASGSEGSVSYTVGQIAYSATTATNGSVSQGVQQPYDVTLILGKDEVPEAGLLLSVYPNPATEALLLKVESENFAGMSFQLSDMQGRLLEDKQITGVVSQIHTGDLLAAIYLLKIKQDGKTISTFKIVKK